MQGEGTIQADPTGPKWVRRRAIAPPWRATPRDCAMCSEAAPLPRGVAERFVGYGVMSLPFAGGDILAFRRFGASSIGPAYSAIWHRDGGSGEWTFYVSIEPALACPRYFGSAIRRVVVTDIDATWVGHDHLVVSAPSPRVEWSMRIQSTPATRALSLMAGLAPAAMWRSRAAVALLESIASLVLGAAPVRMSGITPNGQRFAVRPRRVWRIDASAGSVEGRELGPLGGAGAALGDFRLADVGLFACGDAEFDRLDERRHAITLGDRVQCR